MTVPTATPSVDQTSMSAEMEAPRRNARYEACAGCATNVSPDVDGAIVAAILLRSLSAAALSPPGVALRADTPFSRPGGAASVTGSPENSFLSSANALLSRSSVVSTCSPAPLSIVSCVATAIAASFFVGPSTALCKLRDGTGIGASSSTHSATGAVGPERRGKLIVDGPASGIRGAALSNRAPALSGCKDWMKSPTACWLNVPAHVGTVVEAGEDASRSNSGVTLSFHRSRAIASALPNCLVATARADAKVARCK